jgi:hypothetical protein
MFVFACNYKSIENQLASQLLRPPDEPPGLERNKIREQKEKSFYLP